MNQDHKMADLGQIQTAQKPESLRDLEENKKLARRRKLIIAGLFLGILIFLGGAAYAGYWFGIKKKPAPQVLSDNKAEDTATYRNTRFGYQFDYPKSWQIDGAENSMKMSLLPIQKNEGDKREIKIEAHANDNLSSSSFIEQNLNASDFKEGSAENINYDTKGTMIEGYNGAYKSAFFANKTVAVEISEVTGAEDKDSYSVFEQVLKNFQFVQAEEVTEKTYTIQPGDTLFTISLKFGVDMNTLAQYNGLENPDAIKYGMVLKIPPAGQSTDEKKFNIDAAQAKKYQTEADAGAGSSRLDPVAVAKDEAKGVFGISLGFDFTVVSIDKTNGNAQVRAQSGDKKYLINLIQPVKKGDGGIWAVQLVKKEA
jgi:LysM repeat protein